MKKLKNWSLVKYKTITNTICISKNTAKRLSLSVSFDTLTVFLCVTTHCVLVVTIFSEGHSASIFRKYLPFEPPSLPSQVSSYLTHLIAVTAVHHGSLFHLNNFPVVAHALQVANLPFMFSVCAPLHPRRCQYLPWPDCKNVRKSIVLFSSWYFLIRSKVSINL